MTDKTDDAANDLRDATRGFDALFANDLEAAIDIFSPEKSPFHALGAGVCSFLEAALGMEAGTMATATKQLAEADAGAKRHTKSAKYAPSATRFPAGTEWELLHSDAVILHALTLALSESYMGYLQCFYELNSAHSKFTKIYKTVFPQGVDNYATPSTPRVPSPSPTALSDKSSIKSAKQRTGFFARFTGSNTLHANPVPSTPEGPVEELIMSGAAFGYGLFNLVFSLLPAALRGVVGFLGFKHDRKLALKALAVSANQKDVHAVFAGLVLMTYYGVVLLLSGYQADEEHILKQYRAIIDHVESRYPTGSLWILNRAKLLRMSYDPEGAIKVLQDGLQPERPHTFAQADGMLIFELAWTLLSQRRYEEAAQIFMRMTEINSWSHATYYFIAAGCHVSVKNYEQAQKLLDAIPGLLDKKKIGGKDLPTEVFIKKKLTFYQEKQKRQTGSEDNYAHCIRITPAEELGIFWNTHSRIGMDIAHAHVVELATFSPAVTIPSPLISDEKTPVVPSDPPDLDTPDELAIRSLLLGIVHRTVNEFSASRAFLEDAHHRDHGLRVSTWVGGVACFELAVLELKETEATVGAATDTTKRAAWAKALKTASEQVDHALSLAPQSVDLSSRLDTRINMLRDEIAMKREMIGVA